MEVDALEDVKKGFITGTILFELNASKYGRVPPRKVPPNIGTSGDLIWDVRDGFIKGWNEVEF